MATHNTPTERRPASTNDRTRTACLCSSRRARVGIDTFGSATGLCPGRGVVEEVLVRLDPGGLTVRKPRSSAWVKTPSDTQAVAQVESWRWMGAPGQNDSARPCRLQNSSVRPQGEAIRTRLAAASTRGPSAADRGRSDSQFAAVAKRVRAESVDPQTPFMLRLDERRCSPAHPPTDPGRAVLGGRSPGRGASRRYRSHRTMRPNHPAALQSMSTERHLGGNRRSTDR